MQLHRTLPALPWPAKGAMIIMRFPRSRPISGWQRVFLALALGLFSTGTGRAGDSLLERDVLPILTSQCLGCHGGLRQRGGLDLRTLPGMLQGGDSGPAVKAGDASTSEIWKRIAADEMPPNEKKLSAAEKAAIKQWIVTGLPTVGQRQKDDVPLLSANAKHEPKQVAAAIDQHLDRALAAAKLMPAPRSDDSEFLRRVYLDLTGRVPTAEQAVAFLDSKDPGKRAKLIDELLATPQFGEQMGRTWRDWICPPELPSDANGGKQPNTEAQNLSKWLGTRFAAGDGWDRITRAILTVEGDIKNNPQAIFFGLVGEGGKVTAGARPVRWPRCSWACNCSARVPRRPVSFLGPDRALGVGRLLRQGQR